MKKYRAFISTTLFLAFLLLAFSGVVLFIRPEGSIARWVDWSFLGLAKGDWEDIHNLFSVCFLILGILHLVINWRAIPSYIARRGRKWRSLRPAAMVSGGVIVLLFVFAVKGWWPTDELIRLRKDFKTAGRLVRTPPPIPDLETRDLATLSRLLEIDLPILIHRLRSRGLQVLDSHRTLLEIARHNRISPQDLFSAIRTKP